MSKLNKSERVKKHIRLIKKLYAFSLCRSQPSLESHLFLSRELLLYLFFVLSHNSRGDWTSWPCSVYNIQCELQTQIIHCLKELIEYTIHLTIYCVNQGAALLISTSVVLDYKESQAISQSTDHKRQCLKISLNFPDWLSWVFKFKCRTGRQFQAGVMAKCNKLFCHISSCSSHTNTSHATTSLEGGFVYQPNRAEITSTMPACTADWVAQWDTWQRKRNRIWTAGCLRLSLPTFWSTILFPDLKLDPFSSSIVWVCSTFCSLLFLL